ncbi:MAG: DinB family protein [Gemmatimonadetes bacterium]|nr:DinB family protein [Gemmatimonadota bacterium]
MTDTRNELRYVARILTRDLETLAKEIEAYPDDASLWALPPGASNSGGNLALHLVGNLQHFIGAQLGGTGYVRDRDAEFGSRNVPRAMLVELVRVTIDVVNRTVPLLQTDTLAADFPLPVANHLVNTEEFLLHLAVHFTYHLGQLDYHRKLVTGKATGVGALSPAGLQSARRASG